MKNITFILLTILLFSSCGQHRKVEVLSPDGNIRLELEPAGDRLILQAIYLNDTILHESTLGFSSVYTDQINLKITSLEQLAFDETWEAVNGKNKTVRNHYNQCIIDCETAGEPGFRFQIDFRCYNDGFAYRYLIPEQDLADSITLSADAGRLSFTGEFTFWSYNGEQHNVGPVTLTDPDCPETIRPPMVIQTAGGKYLAILESAIMRYAPFNLAADNSSAGPDNSLQFSCEAFTDDLPVKTSWRTFIMGESPGALLESELSVNLNDPCRIEDPSWIKPGKSMWDWRVWGYRAADGFEYGLNTKSHKRFIDFAAANNIQYLLIDADWYGPEFSAESDPTSTRSGIDIEECMAYAREKGVGVFLYLNDVGAKKFGLERILKQFSEWGASGVKYGFMQGSWEEKVRHTRRVVELCADYKLMVIFHDGPVPPSGDRRTWPNLVAREFCHAQADARRSYFPETAVTSPFVNMLAGPLDYTNGWFALNSAFPRPKVFQEIPGTVAAEVAKLIVVYSGLNVLPDAPEEYLKKDDLFDCIRKMPARFDNYKVLQGEIGQYITVARKAGEDWFIGSLTNREGRVLEIDLGFLAEGLSYTATFYEDAGDSHFLHNKEAYLVRKMNVRSGDVLSVHLAPGGGHAIFITENKPNNK